MFHLCAITLQTLPVYGKTIISSLSVLCKQNEELQLINFYWPSLLENKRLENFNSEEYSKFYNGQDMKEMDGKIELNNEKEFKMSSYINENINNVKQFIQKLAQHYYIILHKNDVEKWLRVKILRDIKIKKVLVVDADYITCALCSIKHEHNALTCTICKSFNIYYLQNFYSFVCNGEHLLENAHKNNLIPEELFNYLSGNTKVKFDNQYEEWIHTKSLELIPKT